MSALGLDDGESWNLPETRPEPTAAGAVTMPEGVDPRDEHFDSRRGPFLRENAAEPKRKVLSWLPTRGVNRRLDSRPTRVLKAVRQLCRFP